jgi:hypothetical protein
MDGMGEEEVGAALCGGKMANAGDSSSWTKKTSIISPLVTVRLCGSTQHACFQCSRPGGAVLPAAAWLYSPSGFWYLWGVIGGATECMVIGGVTEYTAS